MAVLAGLAIVGVIAIAAVLGICLRACVEVHWPAVEASLRRRWRLGGRASRPDSYG